MLMIHMFSIITNIIIINIKNIIIIPRHFNYSVDSVKKMNNFKIYSVVHQYTRKVN